MTISEQKNMLRAQMAEKVRLFCAEQDVAAASARARRAALDSGLLDWAELVLGYLFHGNEADCADVLYRALLAEKSVGVPRVVPRTSDMDFYLIDPALPFGDQIEKGSFGISEPVATLEKLAVDASLAKKRVLALVPGVAFTRDGKRLGRGKGFYDRFISRLRKTGADVTAAGFCFSCQLVDSLPVDSFDQPLDRIFFG